MNMDDVIRSIDKLIEQMRAQRGAVAFVRPSWEAATTAPARTTPDAPDLEEPMGNTHATAHSTKTYNVWCKSEGCGATDEMDKLIAEDLDTDTSIRTRDMHDDIFHEHESTAYRVSRGLYNVLCGACGTPESPYRVNSEPLEAFQTVELRDAHNKMFHPDT